MTPLMPERALAATTIGRPKTELRKYPMPDFPPDAGILKIEAAGVCGSGWMTNTETQTHSGLSE